jgi:hypothetical protein
MTERSDALSLEPGTGRGLIEIFALSVPNRARRLTLDGVASAQASGTVRCVDAGLDDVVDRIHHRIEAVDNLMRGAFVADQLG